MTNFKLQPAIFFQVKNQRKTNFYGNLANTRLADKQIFFLHKKKNLRTLEFSQTSALFYAFDSQSTCKSGRVAEESRKTKRMIKEKRKRI